jgi:hypothetical protein
MQMTEFQENSVWTTKFTELRKQVQVVEHDTHKESDTSAKNLILNAWKPLPNYSEALKRLVLAMLSIFGST